MKDSLHILVVSRNCHNICDICKDFIITEAFFKFMAEPNMITWQKVFSLTSDCLVFTFLLTVYLIFLFYSEF